MTTALNMCLLCVHNFKSMYCGLYQYYWELLVSVIVLKQVCWLYEFANHGPITSRIYPLIIIVCKKAPLAILVLQFS